MLLFMKNLIISYFGLIVTVFFLSEKPSFQSLQYNNLVDTSTISFYANYSPTLLDDVKLDKSSAKALDSLKIINSPKKPSFSPIKKDLPKVKSSLVYFKPLNVKWSSNPGLSISHLQEKELRVLMESEYKFKNLEKKSLYDLRRIWLAYNYDPLFWDVHEKTGFAVSVIYAYFIMEATNKGLESSLMSTYLNPGGIKYKGKGSSTKAYDDCRDSKGRPIKCNFQVYTSYDEMVTGWSNVLNASRYTKCKSEKTAPEICECLYKSGYHTGNNWVNRAALSKNYWEVRKSFPPR